MNIDGTFRPHQEGEISSTFKNDWYLRKGESRDKMGECLKKKKRPIPRSTEDAPSDHTQFPLQRLEIQNNEQFIDTYTLSMGNYLD